VTGDNVRKTLIIGSLLIFSGAYVFLSFTTPPQPAAPGFELYEPWRSLIRISFIAPVLLSWAFGGFAVAHLLTVAELTRNGKAGRMFRLLGYGVLALVIGSWVTTAIGQVRNNFFARGSSLDIASTVAQNYAHVLFPLIGFALIYAASVRRAAEEKREDQSWPAALLLIMVLGAIWIGVIFTNASRQSTTFEFGRPTYYISDPLIILTLVTPMLTAWLLGIAGSLNFSDLESGGAPYMRRAFTKIVHGLLFAVFASIVLSGLQSAGSERLLSGGFIFLLGLVYGLVFLMTISYWMMFRGAKTLLEGNYEHQE
jgi:hypothetical protein